jgi:hypothetical protein
MTKNPFLLISTFFGLNSKEASSIRQNIFRQIHNIVYHGNGGYDWITIYNMPIWLRKFTFKEIQDFNDEQNQKMKSQTNSGKTSLVSSDGQINAPQFQKASKPYQGKSSYK